MSKEEWEELGGLVDDRSISIKQPVKILVWLFRVEMTASKKQINS